MFYYQNEMLVQQRMAEMEKKATHAWKFSSINKIGVFHKSSKEVLIDKDVTLPCQAKVCCATY
ncbi:hypothetical protein JOC85_000778 [Bacillus mesophilus]|uniref:Uncharacterized protein n=1 Tax=Bacillus mesophilus TaxID=1808955 RepID=A0A6M0Q3T5_9BACI|nr:hypothetical protein [Bacillus mesophilus]MBM7660011.1 hypothetical protein [Bacillus mesophilus]NEY70872.1 hypothetical protein [Bacillus mesophilus]